jgi:HSP20 family protein
MSMQTDQKSLSVRSNEPQEQSTQRKGMARSYPGSGLLQRRGESLFGLAPHELFRANPFSLLRRMTEEMDRVFQEVGLEREAGNGVEWTPAIEVSQREGKFNIHAELPGLEPKDVKVEAENDALVIQGERKFEREEKNEGVPIRALLQEHPFAGGRQSGTSAGEVSQWRTGSNHSRSGTAKQPARHSD